LCIGSDGGSDGGLGTWKNGLMIGLTRLNKEFPYTENLLQEDPKEVFCIQKTLARRADDGIFVYELIPGACRSAAQLPGNCIHKGLSKEEVNDLVKRTIKRKGRWDSSKYEFSGYTYVCPKCGNTNTDPLKTSAGQPYCSNCMGNKSEIVTMLRRKIQTRRKNK
jgi:hypothetical protein